MRRVYRGPTARSTEASLAVLDAPFAGNGANVKDVNAVKGAALRAVKYAVGRDLAWGGGRCYDRAMSDEKIRVLIAKPGLDGHDRGAKVVARALRDAGMEVIYTGIRQTPEMIAEAALQEDVDVIGLSILSGAHMELFPRVVKALRDRQIAPDEVLLFAGGIIPDADIEPLKATGFQAIFGPGTSTEDIIKFVREWAATRPARAT